MSYTIEQLLSLSVRDQCIKSTYDSILVVPTGHKSETGYMMMAIIGMKDRWELVEIAGYCETILWKVSEFINPSIENLKSDMDFETWVMHYFTEWKFEVSAIFSDLAYVSVIHNK